MRKKPNILFFFTDDQRFDTIHAMGCREIHTPNIDRLADRGVTFPNAYIMGGKISFGGMSEHFTVPLNDCDPTGQYPPDRIYHEPKRHSSDIFCGQMKEYLTQRGRGRKDRSFFSYVSFTAPDNPRDTHPRYHAIYDARKLPPPENLMPVHPFDNGELRIRDELPAPFPRNPEIIQEHLADYYAMITHVDAQIGMVCRVSEETGQAEDTIIVFSGDNGLAPGRHGLMGKQSLYDHGAHVPLIFAGPGVGSTLSASGANCAGGATWGIGGRGSGRAWGRGEGLSVFDVRSSIHDGETPKGHPLRGCHCVSAGSPSPVPLFPVPGSSLLTEGQGALAFPASKCNSDGLRCP